MGRGVCTFLPWDGGCGARYSSYFEEEDTDDYVACDVFSKLKFDDLRKVHKDQTVFVDFAVTT